MSPFKDVEKQKAKKKWTVESTMSKDTEWHDTTFRLTIKKGKVKVTQE